MINFSIQSELREARLALSDHLGRKVTQEDMARACGVSLAGYKRWERGEVSVKSLYSFIQGIRRLVPELGPIEVSEAQRLGFGDWLRRELGKLRTGESTISPSAAALEELLAEGTARAVLGIHQPLAEHLRDLLKKYRADLDRDDWIVIVKMVQEGREAEEEWKFTDPSVVKAQMYFKSTRVLTTEELRKVERIVQSALLELQAEEKKQRQEGGET